MCVQATIMPATVNLNRLATHKPHLKAGAVYSLIGFDVTRLNWLFRYLLNLSGRVTGIKMYKGWCYVSCSQCAKKLQRTVASFTCLSCNNINTVGVLRYRVEMSVADETVKLCLFVSIGCIEPLLTQAGDGVNPDMEGDDDNGEDNSGAISVAAKVKAGGSSQAEGASDKVKKARKA
ncbi:hypothetical protein DY000_02063557 [Brassica cretica]|uniref:Replication factor A C-terminal domain-containing protein n=1 Tax=Brassica cretica TaxID=69181 RepID=A0ABQ7ARW6_BRACR|nr:hypothetical protein DY000_02063557 [Brassica cretica]